MMLLSKSVRHGIYVLCYLSRQDPSSIEPASTIAEAMNVPIEHASKILQSLKSAGLVNSTRGRSGGYQLARSIEAISVADVVNAVATPPPNYGLEPRNCPRAGETACQAYDGLIRLHEGIQDYLAKQSLGTIVGTHCEDYTQQPTAEEPVSIG